MSQPGLPAEVAATRAAIFAAASSCDLAALEALTLEGDHEFTASFGGGAPAQFWADLETRGDPVLADMMRHLNQPYAGPVGDDPGAEAFYVWPSAFIELQSPQGDGLPAEHYQALLELYTLAELENMFGAVGGYVGWRHGIAADGEWQVFVAGD